jgi:hypothetical protein
LAHAPIGPSLAGELKLFWDGRAKSSTCAPIRTGLRPDPGTATLDAAPGGGTGRGRHRKYLPYAFTEHGAIMAANLLNSPRAVEVSVYVVRAFVRLRELAATHGDLAQRLDELEQKTEGLAMSHDTFSRNTRNQLKQLIEAVNQLMVPPDPPKRPIGFVLPQDKGKKTKGAKKQDLKPAL